MTKSMTGFGRHQQLVNGHNICFEIKSVNHRYFEFASRIPRSYGYLEEKLKKYVQNFISRGKVDVSVTILTADEINAEVEINKALAKGYIDALREANDYLDLNDDLSLSIFSRFQDVFTVKKTEEDEEIIWDCVKKVADKAIDSFIKMRELEGTKMKEDIYSRLEFIEKSSFEIEDFSTETVIAYRNKLYSKLKEVLKDNSIDEQRILTEAAIFSEKIATDEETVRLRSHISQFKKILKCETGEAIGRKLDFLVQELNREINTIGSKANDLNITEIVVNSKSELEKIREQIQNIE